MSIGNYFPEFASRFPSVSNATAMNAATIKSAMMGHIYWTDKQSHVVSSAGGQIKFVSGTSITFANGGTTIDVGIQDIDTSNGPPVRPDGTFDVKGTLTGGVNTITDSTLITVSMSTGSKTIAHGLFAAIVLDMTARSGSDVVRTSNISGPFSSGINNRPTMTQLTSSAWNNGAGGSMPNAFIVADDGTLGFFSSAVPMIATATENWSDTSNPDERGMIFQLPYAATCDACWIAMSGGVAAADTSICIYSDPTGTPTQMFTPVAVLGENYERNSNSALDVMFGSEINLAANTDYCLAVKGSSTSSISMSYIQLPDTNCRKFITRDTTLKKATRNNGSGAFTAESPATTIYQMAVRVQPISGGTVYPRSGLQGISEGMAR